MANRLAFDALAPGFNAFSPTGFPSGAMLGPMIRTAVVWQLLAADLLALPGTKIQLVPSPTANPPAVPGTSGANYILIAGRTYFQYQFKTTAYTLGNADNTFQIEYTGKAVALVSQAANGLVTLTSSAGVNAPQVNAGILTVANSANLGLELTLVGTAPALTLGDGLLYVTMEYSIVTIFP
jgi:hypothetical protein